MRGRVMNLWPMVYRGAPAIGALLIGVVSDDWGFQKPFLATSAFFLMALLYVIRRRRSLNDHLQKKTRLVFCAGRR